MELCEQSDEYTPELAHAGSDSPIEVEIPEAQNMDELPDPMPKMETSNHKMNTCWFVEFSWLNLGGNKKSLYCMTCYWAFNYKRFNPIDMRICEGNNNMVWINREAGWVNFKKGRGGIVKHGDCGLHKRQSSRSLQLDRHTYTG